MSCPKSPWEDLRYRTSSLPELERTEHQESYSTLGEEFDHHVLPLDEYGLYDEGNKKDIFTTISMNPREPHVYEFELI